MRFLLSRSSNLALETVVKAQIKQTFTIEGERGEIVAVFAPDKTSLGWVNVPLDKAASEYTRGGLEALARSCRRGKHERRLVATTTFK